jgi:hypothetical protein
MKAHISTTYVPLHGIPLSLLARVETILKESDNAAAVQNEMNDGLQQRRTVYDNSTRRLDDYYAYAFANEDSSFESKRQQLQQPLMKFVLLFILAILVVSSVVIFAVRCRRYYKGRPKLVMDECDCGGDASLDSNEKTNSATGKALKLLNEYHSTSAAPNTSNTVTAVWRSGMMDGSSPVPYRRPSSPGNVVPAQSYVTMA